MKVKSCNGEDIKHRYECEIADANGLDFIRLSHKHHKSERLFQGTIQLRSYHVRVTFEPADEQWWYRIIKIRVKKSRPSRNARRRHLPSFEF